ncbi:reverse transcriptase domain-containing protein [Tanacetum coccineum]
MPFGLCNAPVTFQRRMTAIFHDMCKDFMEVFMDEFSVFGNSFDSYLANLSKMLARCEEKNLISIGAFDILKDKWTYAPVIVAPNWNLDFELMCDASDYVIGAVLGQRIDKKFHPIYYAKFTIKIKDKKGTENLATDHLSRLENPELEKLNEEAIRDSFPDEHLMAINVREAEDDPWRCVSGKELQEILEHCHMGPTGGHYGADITAKKIFESGFYWPTIFKDAARYIRECDACQRAGNISSRNQMPLTNILWVEAEALPTNDARVVVKFLRRNRKEWANRLDDTLWAFRTAYKSPIGSTAFRIAYGKACHLPIEMKHKAYWALKNVNLDLDSA